MIDDKETYLQPSSLKVIETITTDSTLIPEHIGKQPMFLNGCTCGFCVAERKEESKN